MPLEFDMKEHASKEKFANLEQILSSNDSVQGDIKVGDLMLYRSDTLVLFYKDFNENFYKYIKIGTIKNTDELLKALGNADVKVKFKLQK
ncbi:cyclophilin-like fold protein [Campylobacter sp. MOP51]|uniref:cyclophilin-like fold protein n=1 Tax=Campylobacter canis TaxID=3378588 RepID=UPI003C5A6373